MAAAKSVSFLDLPVELRLEVYRAFLVRNEPILVEKLDLVPWTRLSKVCPLVKEEAESILWSENIFQVVAEDANLTLAIEWLKQIGYEKASSIQNFTIEYRHSNSAVMSIGSRLGHWRPEYYRLKSQRLRGEIHREYQCEMTCQFRYLVPQMRQLCDLGLYKSSVNLAAPVKPPKRSFERESRFDSANSIMIGMHRAFNRKIRQLVEGSYFHVEEEMVVQEGKWSVMLIFETGVIHGPIFQSSYLNRGKLVLDRTAHYSFFRGEPYRVVGHRTSLF